MECHYCQTIQRKLYCQNCLQEKLHNHVVELTPLTTDRTNLVSQANDYVSTTSRIRGLLQEKNKRITVIKEATSECRRINEECSQARQRIQQLRAEIQQRRNKMTMIEKSHSETEMTDYAKDIQQTKRKWYRVHKLTVSARRVLVHEIVSLFEFKPGVVEDRSAEPERGQHSAPSISPTAMATALPFAPIKDKSQHSEDLYICGVTLPARTIDVSKYSKEELNASIGLLIHILGLIVRYLGIKLPNPVFYKSVHPYVRYNSGKQRHSTKIPLFLDDKNFRRFTIGMAMLNYNIAYLCYTQGVEIPLSQVTNALQALMECCRSPRIGIRSHVTIYQGIPSINDFPLEFHQVLRMTVLRYRSGLSSELSKELVFYDLLNNGGFDSTGKIGLADDWYFYDGLLDNDEEDDIQDDEVVDDQVDESTSERWNLVDVMPSFGRPNGESESIFQFGATMIGMMESLGGRTVMGSIAGATSEPNASASPSSSQYPSSQRRQDYHTKHSVRRYM